MAEHQGLPVSGYRPQSDNAVALVNNNKHAEECVLRVIDDLAAAGDVDPCWLEIAREHIELGFMALNRAIFRPSRILLPEDGQ